jgi:DNA invertase Pin-like site-specific DNA recombinase
MRNVVAYCIGMGAARRPLRRAPPGAGDPAVRRGEGLAIRSIYMDPGVSGSSLDRPDLQRLIADCHAGKIAMVIMQDPERLSRDASQLLALLHIFQKTGVRIEFGTPDGRSRLASLKVYLAALLELEKAKAVTGA